VLSSLLMTNIGPRFRRECRRLHSETVEAGRLRQTIDRARERSSARTSRSRKPSASVPRSQTTKPPAAGLSSNAFRSPAGCDHPRTRPPDCLSRGRRRTASSAYVENETHTISYRLRDLAARLDPSLFVRLGRGTLVNVEISARIVRCRVEPSRSPNDNQEFRVSRLQSRVLRDSS